jgi:hypothetical protein
MRRESWSINTRISSDLADAEIKAWLLALNLERTLAQASAYDRAIDLARAIEEPSQRAGAFQSVVEALALADRADLVLTLCDEATTAVRATGDYHPRAAALRWVAMALGQVGAYDRAINLTCTIEPDRERASTFRIIAGRAPLLPFVQQTWSQAASRSYLLQILPLASRLIAVDPDLGTALVAEFAWVSEFFKR